MLEIRAAVALEQTIGERLSEIARTYVDGCIVGMHIWLMTNVEQ